MCVTPISQEKLSNMHKYKYQYTNHSFVYNKMMSPMLNVVVNYLPYKLAPNLITAFSLMCNIIAFVVVYFEAGFDFSKKLKSSTCIIVGVTQLLYQLLDNVDGKQARRTGTSTPFGMLMDHGCDVFTNIFTAFNLSHLFLVGNEGLCSFSVFFGLLFGFYMMTFEDYKVGQMIFGVVNGVDEGNFFIFLFGVTVGITGQDWLNYVALSGCNLTVGKICGLILFTVSFSTVVNLLRHSYTKHGLFQTLKILVDCLWFYNSVVMPIIYAEYYPSYYKEFSWLIIISGNLLFARTTLDLIIKTITLDKVALIPLAIITNIVYLISFFSNDILRTYSLLTITTTQAVELIMYVIIRSNEVTNFLGIKIFTIDPKIPI